MPAKRKLDERLHLRREVRRLLGRGKTEDEIKSELCFSDIDWVNYRSTIIENEKTLASRPPIEIFIEYQLRQLQHVEELEKAREKALTAGQPQHVVSAVKAKAELLDKIIQRGQDLGIYYREGQKLTVRGAMGLVHMSPKQLAEQLDRSVLRLKALSDDLGHPLELTNVVRVTHGEQAALRLVEPLPEDDPPAPQELPELEEPPPEPEEVPARDEPLPDPDDEAPPPEPRKAAPERKKRSAPARRKSSDGDPGSGHPLAERVYKAAMEPRPNLGPRRPDEIVGDPAGLRARVFASCQQCGKRCCGVQGLQRHIHFLHQVPEAQALEMARKSVDDERMSMAREYAERAQETDD